MNYAQERCSRCWKQAGMAIPDPLPGYPSVSLSMKRRFFRDRPPPENLFITH